VQVQRRREAEVGARVHRVPRRTQRLAENRTHRRRDRRAPELGLERREPARRERRAEPRLDAEVVRELREHRDLVRLGRVVDPENARQTARREPVGDRLVRGDHEPLDERCASFSPRGSIPSARASPDRTTRTPRPARGRRRLAPLGPPRGAPPRSGASAASARRRRARRWRRRREQLGDGVVREPRVGAQQARVEVGRGDAALGVDAELRRERGALAASWRLAASLDSVSGSMGITLPAR